MGRRYWRGPARRCGPWRRHWDFRKDLLVGGPQFGDLAHYLILTGCELLDCYSHTAKLLFDSLLQRGDMCLYLL